MKAVVTGYDNSSLAKKFLAMEDKDVTSDKIELLLAVTKTAFYTDPQNFLALADKTTSVTLALYKNPIRRKSNMEWAGVHDGFSALCDLAEFMGAREDTRAHFLDKSIKNAQADLVPHIYACTLTGAKPVPSKWWSKEKRSNNLAFDQFHKHLERNRAVWSRVLLWGCGFFLGFK